MNFILALIFEHLLSRFELLQSYEKDHGKLSELDESDYPKITGSQFLQNEENAPKS